MLFTELQVMHTKRSRYYRKATHLPFLTKKVNKCIINHKTHFKIHFILQIFQYLQYNVRFKNTAESIID